MKPITNTSQILLDTDGLDQKVMRNAASTDEEGDETIAEQLVRAGNVEADLEQRVAAAETGLNTP